MPPIVEATMEHLIRSKGTYKGFITSLIPKLERCCNADPFNAPDNLDALSMNLKLADGHIQNIVEGQRQIQEMHIQDVTVSEAELNQLAHEHDKELEKIRLLVTKCNRLIEEARVRLPSNAAPSATDSTRRVAKVKLPTLEIMDFHGDILSFNSF